MATFYWVGGSGTWDLTTETNWSETSGGPGGQGVPTQYDDVVFDNNSDAGVPFTVTLATSATNGATVATCRDVTISRLEQSMSLAGTSAVTNYLAIYGSLFFPPTNLSVTTNASLIFYGPGDHFITCNGVNLPSNQIFQQVGDYYLNGAYTTAGIISHESGGFYTVGYNVTAAYYQTNGSNNKFAQFYSSKLTFNNATAFNNAGTNYTLDPGTSEIICTAASPTFTTGNITLYDLSFTNTSPGTTTITGTNTFNNLSVASPTSSPGIRFFGISGTQTINGTLTLGTNNTPVNRIYLYSSTFGSTRTITAANVSPLVDVNFRDITMTNPVSGTRLGNNFGNNGITFDAGKNVYWNLATGGNWSSTAWALSPGGSVNINNFPLPQDTVNFVDTGLNASASVTFDNTWYLGNLNCSARTLAMTLNTSTFSAGFTGSITLSSVVTLAGTGNISLEGINPYSITSAGRTFTQPVIVSGVGSTCTLNDALTTTNSLTVLAGTLNTNNYSVTSTTLTSSTTTYARNITLGTSTLTLTGTSPVTLVATNLTTSMASSTIVCNSTSSFTFAGGGLTFGTVNFSATSGSSITMTGANTFSNINITRSASSNLRLLSVSNNITITGTLNFGAPVNATYRIFVYSANILSRVTITAAAISNFTDVDFRDIAGAGTATWSGTRIGDCSNNSNITFNAAKTVYWNLAAGGSWNSTAWALSSGGTVDVNNFPLAQDTAVIGNTGLNASVSITLGSWNIGTINASTRTLAATIAQSTADPVICGDINLSSSITWTATTTPTLNFHSVGKTHNITAPNSIPSAFYIYAQGGSVKLLTNLDTTSSVSFVLIHGTLDLNGFTLSTRALLSNYSSTRSIAFGSTGKINITYPVSGSSATIVDVRTTTGITVTGDNPIIDITPNITGTATRTIQWSTAGTAYPFPGTLKISAGSDYISPQGRWKNVDYTGFSGFGYTNFTLTGNLTLSTGMTSFGGSTLTIGGGVPQTLTLNGKTLQSNIDITSNSSVTLSENLIIDPLYGLTLTSGTFNANGFNVTTGSFSSSGTSARTLNMGSGTWSITNTNSTVWNLATTTNLTFNAGTSTLVFAYDSFLRAASVQTVQGGGLTYYNLSWPGTSDRLRLSIYGANTFNNFTITPSSAGNKSLIISADQTINGTLSMSGSSYSNRLGVLGGGTLSPISGYLLPLKLIVNNIGPLSYVDFRGIEAAGNSIASGNWSGTNLGNCVANINIDFDPPKTVYWNNATSGSHWGSNSWASSSGGTPSVANFPLAQDTSIFDDTGTSSNMTIELDKFWYSFGNIDFSRVSKPITLYTGNVVQVDTYGSLTFSPSMVVTGTGRWYQSGPGSITCAGLTLPIQYTIGIYNNGELTLNDNFTSAYFLGSNALSNGVLNLNNNTFRCQTFNSSGSNVRTINFGPSGTGKFVIDGNNTTVWTTSTSSNMTNIGTPNVEFSYTGRTGTRTIVAGGNVGNYGMFNFKVLGGSDKVTTTGTTNSLDWDFTGFNGTFLNVVRKFWGNVTYSTGMTIQGGTGIQTYSNYLPGQTVKIITNGKLLDFPITIDAVDGVVQMQDALNMTSTRTLTLTAGTFDLNNYTVTTGIFSSNNSNIRALDFDTARIVITGNATTVFNVSTSTNLSIIGKPTVDLVYGGSSGIRTVNVGGTAGPVSSSVAIDFNIKAGTDQIALNSGSTAVYGSIDFTGFSGTSIAAGNSRNIYGGIILSATMSHPESSQPYIFLKQNAVSTIKTSGISFGYPIVVNAPNGTIIIEDDFLAPTKSITLTAGTLDTGGHNLTIGSLTSIGSLERALILGVSTVTASGSDNVWNIVDSGANMTISADKSNIILSYNSIGNVVFKGGIKQYNNVTFENTTENSTSFISDSNIFNTVTVYGPSTLGRRVFYVFGNQTINRLNILGTDNLRRVHFISLNRPSFSSLNINVTSPLSDIEFKDIHIIGSAAPLTGTRLSDCGDNTGIIFDAPKTVYWNKPAGGNITDDAWALSSGGSTSLLNYPLAQDTLVFDNAGINLLNPTITCNVYGQFGTMDFSVLNKGVTLSLDKSISLYGDLILSDAVTISGTAGLAFNCSAITQNFTVNGGEITTPIEVDIVNNGTLVLNDDLPDISSFTLVSGNLDMNNHDITTPTFLTNYSNNRSINFRETSVLYLTGNNTTIWAANDATGLVLYGTNKVVANYSGSTGTRTFAHSNINSSATQNNVINLYVTAGTDLIATSGAWGTIDFTGFSGVLGTNNRDIYGDLILSPTMSTSSTSNNTRFVGTAPVQNFAPNGVVFPYTTRFMKTSGKVVLQGALNTSTRLMYLDSGEFDANDYNVTTESFACGTAVTTSPVLYMGSGTWTITGYSFDVRSVSLSLNAETSTIDMASASTKLFAGKSGGTFYNVRNTGTGILSFSRSGNYNDLTSTVSPATITFDSNYLYFNNFSIGSVSGITLAASVPGTPYRLINRSNGEFILTGMTISDANVYPDQWWVAQTSNGNTDAGNNSGIVFSGLPIRAKMLAMF